MTNSITKLLNTECNKEDANFYMQMEKNPTGTVFFIMMTNPERVAGVTFVNHSEVVKDIFIDKDLIGAVLPNDIQNKVNRYRGICI